MESARKGVVCGIEFAAGVELGEDDFNAAHFGFCVFVGGHTAPVVFYRSRAVLPQFYGYFVGVAVCGFVYGVIYNFPKDVVQALDTGRAYIHTGAHAHRFKSFEYF